MSLPLTWQELTERNIATIQSIFRESNLSTKDGLAAYAFAYEMVKGTKFDQDSASGRWNVLHNALRIVVTGLQVLNPPTKVAPTDPPPDDDDDDRPETEEEQTLRLARNAEFRMSAQARAAARKREEASDDAQ